MRRHYVLVSCFVFLAAVTNAQLVRLLPQTSYMAGDLPTGLTLYVPATKQLIMFSENQAWLFDQDGRQTAGPFLLRNDGGDVFYPRISGSGKQVAFLVPGKGWLTENDRIALYDLDSGYIKGTYELPMMSTPERVRFSGDSVLHYYTRFSMYKSMYNWLTDLGKIKHLFVKEDSIHSGLYDLAYFRERTLGIYREGDSLSLICTGGNKPDVYTLFKLAGPAVQVEARFADGFPYSIIGDAGSGTTRIYEPRDSLFSEIARLPHLPDLLAAAGTPDRCFMLYRDTTGSRTVVKLFDTKTNEETSLPFPELITADHVIAIYPDQMIFTASHPANREIRAYNLATGLPVWASTPHPVPGKDAASGKPAIEEDGLFKVLVKQGSDDVTGSWFNPERNQLLLVKNNEKLITVDADAKCAVRWEQFYKDKGHVTEVKLFPGENHLLYAEQRWERDENAEDADINRDKYVYPYAYRVFDRRTSKVIFSLRTITGASVHILNDSLICWTGSGYIGTEDSLSIYNILSGKMSYLHPLPGVEIDDFKPVSIGGRLYFLLSTRDERLIISSEGKAIFSRKYPGQSSLVEYAKFLPNSPYLYFVDAGKGAVNWLYRINGDSVKPVRKFPAGISIMAGKATASGCYFLYSKKYVRKKGEINHYRFINMITGTDKLVDSAMNDGEYTYAVYEIFPDENYYIRDSRNIITWHDLASGYEYKNFGRDEPGIISLTYSPEGRYLAAANPDGKVMLWDLGTGKETKTLSVGTGGYITKLAFSGDGNYLAASSGDIWETATGKNVVSVTDGSIWNVNSIDFSNDGKRIISGGACIISWDAEDGSKLVFHQEPGREDMDTTNLCFNPRGCVDPNFSFMVHSTAFHPNSRDFITGNRGGIIQKWNTETRKMQAYKVLGYVSGQQERTVYELKFSRDGSYILAVQQKSLYRLDPNTLQVLDSLILPEGDQVLGIDMGYDGNTFGCITSRQNGRIVQIRNIHDLSVKQEFYTDGASFNKISFSPNGIHAATASDDGFCTIWDIPSGKPVMNLSTIGEYGNIMVTPDNFYMASKSALDGVTFFKDGSFYSFDQFDLFLNRPDIVLGRLGYASPELLNFYRNAYHKRLRKARGNINDSTWNESVPVLKLDNKKNIPAVTTSGSLGLTFDISDSPGTKGELEIWINGNLVLENQFEEGGEGTMKYSDTVLLGQGMNNIEAVYRNGLSLESRKEKVAVVYNPPKKLPVKVWFIGVGVSRYGDREMNLKYPVKDINDIAVAFKKKFPGIIIDTLLNERATKENILALHEKLMKTTINDRVIVSFSGHGLLSDSLDWYFATHDVDFKKPELRGLSYAMMESILDGIPARQKLLLMDACHSGEVDKESDITFANKETGMDENVVTTAKGLIKNGESKVGLQTSFELMQDMFANLSNSNGTTVLSAAGGKEYALESDTWKNGVFTYSLLRALKDPLTDEDGNKKVSVKELKKAVFNAVRALTGGRQKPTSRVEVLDDWDLW